MSYSVKKDGSFSARFTASLGILQGDPLSPTLFLLFILDLIFTDHPSDISLLEQLISHLEHADDLAIFATKAHALQQKLNTLAKWARDNAMTINPEKSAVLIFSSSPQPPVLFILGSHCLRVEEESCYLGFSMVAQQRTAVMDANYESLVSKAKDAGVILFTMDSTVGKLRPKEALSIYHALVEANLSYGADFMIDTRASLLSKLETVQLKCLRRILALHDHSVVSLLFSETGIWPIKYRRLDLALKYAKYLIALPTDTWAWKAWAESTLLHSSFTAGDIKTQSGWTHDLSLALPMLNIPPHYSSWSMALIDEWRKTLRVQMERSIVADLPSSRTPAVVCRSLTTAPVLKRRAYLDIPTLNHRLCLTRLLFASHNFAVESLRHLGLPNGDRVPREARLCRLCGSISGCVEDIPHALFACQELPRLVTLRLEFFANLPDVVPATLHAPSETDLWNSLIILWADDPIAAAPLGRLAWHCTRLFYAFEPLLAPVISLLPTPINQDNGSDYSAQEDDF